MRRLFTLNIPHDSSQRRHVSPIEENGVEPAGVNGDDDTMSVEGQDHGTDGLEDEEGEESGNEAEEEEWHGLQASTVPEVEDVRTGTKPKKPPTGEELRNIKDAADLYRSSSFKLQVRAPAATLVCPSHCRGHSSSRSTRCCPMFVQNTNVQLHWTVFCLLFTDFSGTSPRSLLSIHFLPRDSY